eukprot:CAMPEP_0203751968 /NCGR_PEP_ID=MMETSP0098-20131031/5957_1 /ASSEMBLY_ACC=CAM_ASM_000208 /TAXON_ID=96639 /ORGANISM=" , Strain NY0313808BC1" /LENGTH=1209 /DNA_ID=CAMNT_0050641935 /DNA_START=223 /DNA_END=3852 /DNA_ORIENTATION=+
MAKMRLFAGMSTSSRQLGDRRKGDDESSGGLSKSLPSVQNGKPFVTIKLKDKEERTRVGDDVSNCTWNEEFVFDVTGLWDEDEDQQDLELKIDVKDSAKIQSYGWASIPLGRLSGSNTIKQWYQLTRPEWSKADEEDDDSGNISVSSANLSEPEESTEISSLADESCGVLLLSIHFEDDDEDENTDASVCRSENASRNENGDTDGSPKPRIRSKPRTLPTRLADYVVLAKLGRDATEPALVERFPRTNHEDLHLPLQIELFIFAFEELNEGFGGDESSEKSDVAFFAFVHAPQGVPLYGYCLMFPSEGENTEEPSTSCLCIVSRLNNGDMFRDLLLEMYKEMTSVPVENDDERAEIRRRISHRLIFDIPMPLPGVLQVQFNISRNSDVFFECQLGKMGTCPSLTFSNGLDFMFKKLGVSKVIELWGAVMLEYKIVLHSQTRWMLSMATETLLALLYPFRWHHTYVSVLPAQLLECVQAPLPFIFGINSALVCEIPDIDLNDIILVDLDCGVVRKGSAVHSELLPAPEMRRLTRMLNCILARNPAKLDDPTYLDWNMVDDVVVPDEKVPSVQACFLECICQILQGYRECLFFLNQSMPVFNTPKFIERRGHDVPFYARFLETQAFEGFKEVQQSQILATFHAYFFRLRIRNRNREQYLALTAQKRYIQERRRAAKVDPDEDDFDGLIRNRGQPANIGIAKKREARNENVWLAQDRRRLITDVSGLEPLDVRVDDDGDSDATEEDETPSVVGKFISKCEEDTDSTSRDLRTIARCMNIEYGRLLQAVRDLRTVLGTQNFSEDRYPAALAALSDDEADSSGGSDVDQLSGPGSGKTKGTVSRRRRSSLAKVSGFDTDYGNQRSTRDRKAELVLQGCITKIFLNQAVPDDKLKACGEQFLLSKHARDLFILILYQPHHRISHSYGTKARGLREGAFKSLVFLCQSLIDSCTRKEDYSNARQMLELSQSYYLDRSLPAELPTQNALLKTFAGRNNSAAKTMLENRRRSQGDSKEQAIPVSPEDYLEAFIRDLPLWHSLLFWEDAFAEMLNMEFRKRVRSQSAADQEPGSSDLQLHRESSFKVGAQEPLTPSASTRPVTLGSTSRALRRMTTPPNELGNFVFNTEPDKGQKPNDQNTPSDSFGRHTNRTFQDVLFELATQTVYKMVGVGAPEMKARALVERLVTQHGLSAENEVTLGILIENISKAAKITSPFHS